jgi:hypothetical protein
VQINTSSNASKRIKAILGSQLYASDTVKKLAEKTAFLQLLQVRAGKKPRCQPAKEPTSQPNLDGAPQNNSNDAGLHQAIAIR